MIGRSLQAQILARLNESPDRRCICFYGARETVHWQSRSQLYSKSVAVAQQLRQEGVCPGDICIIVLPSGENSVNALLATLLLGAVPLLIAPPTMVGGNLELHQTLHGVLRSTRPRVVVCSPSIKPDVAGFESSFPAIKFVFPPDVEGMELKNEPFAPVLPAPTDIAAMQLTSGTTAAPRICMWDHKGVLAALDGMAAAMALSAADLCANWTPLYHDMGLVNNFFLCLARGIPLVLLSPQEFARRPALWLRSLSQTGATITWSPNFGFALTVRRAQDSEIEGVRLDHVRAFWNAAERIHAETLDAFHCRFATLGIRREALKTNFGCAENIGGATFSRANELPPCEHIDCRFLEERGIARVSPATNDAEKIVLVSAGVAHPALNIRILSPRGRVLPDGRVGEICLDTPSRMLRYHQNARETRRALRGGLLHTGDLGYLRNGHLFWVGRLRERITIHSKKIDPSAFETIFASTLGLREGCFAAFGVPDEQLGTERLIIVGEVRSPITESLKKLTATISRKCFLQLGITPGDIVLVPSGTLAKTSSGKRRHRYFRKFYLDGGLEQARMSLSDSMPVAAVAAQDTPESHLEPVSKLPLK
ncbi:MAG TPA: AMP-binding protein [Candidatus Angelobacter sp.]|nr:AMP-binding protein [Candidatus Angelobacter sp.]